MLLILPVFLGIVFSIMEIGYISFRLIVLNHATYEAARVGGMTWGKCAGGGGSTKPTEVMQHFLPAAVLSCIEKDDTPPDTQANQPTCDVECTGQEQVKLIFPISSIILAKPAGSGSRLLVATVRMPVEQPLKQ